MTTPDCSPRTAPGCRPSRSRHPPMPDPRWARWGLARRPQSRVPPDLRLAGLGPSPPRNPTRNPTHRRPSCPPPNRKGPRRPSSHRPLHHHRPRLRLSVTADPAIDDVAGSRRRPPWRCCSPPSWGPLCSGRGQSHRVRVRTPLLYPPSPSNRATARQATKPTLEKPRAPLRARPPTNQPTTRPRTQPRTQPKSRPPRTNRPTRPSPARRRLNQPLPSRARATETGRATTRAREATADPERPSRRRHLCAHPSKRALTSPVAPSCEGAAWSQRVPRNAGRAMSKREMSWAVVPLWTSRQRSRRRPART